jgi:hypothetical protein
MERARTNSRIRGQSRTILKKTTSGRTRIAKPSMSSFRIFSPRESSIMASASSRPSGSRRWETTPSWPHR